MSIDSRELKSHVGNSYMFIADADKVPAEQRE